MAGSIMLLLLICMVMSYLYSEYVLLEAKREAFQDFYKMQTKHYNENNGEHKVFTEQRVLVHIFILVVCIYKMSWIFGPIFFFGLWCTFMFIHDNAYYYYRHVLDPNVYDNTPLDNQTTGSNSKLDQKKLTTPIIRNILFLIGWVIILTTTIIMVFKMT